MLQPFVITAKRQQIGSEIFRPDHSLPTMSIEEYLEGELQKGGILASNESPNVLMSHANPPKSQDVEAIEEEAARRKAIEWDDFVERNPRGLGNTMNRG